MTDELADVTVDVRANVYFDGAVTSRTVHTADGERVTLGVVRPGTYTFETAEREEIEFTNGSGRVVLPDEGEREYAAGDVVVVPPGASFDITADDLVEYVCRYG